MGSKAAFMVMHQLAITSNHNRSMASEFASSPGCRRPSTPGRL